MRPRNSADKGRSGLMQAAIIIVVGIIGHDFEL